MISPFEDYALCLNLKREVLARLGLLEVLAWRTGFPAGDKMTVSEGSEDVCQMTQSRSLHLTHSQVKIAVLSEVPYASGKQLLA